MFDLETLSKLNEYHAEREYAQGLKHQSDPREIAAIERGKAAKERVRAASHEYHVDQQRLRAATNILTERSNPDALESHSRKMAAKAVADEANRVFGEERPSEPLDGEERAVYSGVATMRRLTITAPLKNNDGVILDTLHADIETWLIDEYGAFTRHQVFGIWKDSKTGKTYKDPNVMYEIYTDEPVESLHPLAKKIKVEAQQECVMVTCDENIIFQCQ